MRLTGWLRHLTAGSYPGFGDKGSKQDLWNMGGGGGGSQVSYSIYNNNHTNPTYSHSKTKSAFLHHFMYLLSFKSETFEIFLRTQKMQSSLQNTIVGVILPKTWWLGFKMTTWHCRLSPCLTGMKAVLWRKVALLLEGLTGWLWRMPGMKAVLWGKVASALKG